MTRSQEPIDLIVSTLNQISLLGITVGEISRPRSAEDFNENCKVLRSICASLTSNFPLIEKIGESTLANRNKNQSASNVPIIMTEDQISPKGVNETRRVESNILQFPKMPKA